MGEKLKGSEALRESLPYGAVKEMALVFKKSDAWIAQVIAGKKIGNPLFIECAEKIAALETRSKDELKKILKGYETN
jgi:hypothetical protein